MRRAITVGLAVLALGGCATTPPQERFEAMMITSREGRDAQTLNLAGELLADPAVPRLLKARTEMTVALVHIRSKSRAEAQAALDRAKALGVESDAGYFQDHLSEYEGWVAALP